MFNSLYIIISTGFAIFSMFFGSGNLVFPLALGQIAGDSYGPAFYGLVLTAIITPLMGLVALLRLDGDIHGFFRPLGKNMGYVVPLVVILILCPFGAIPRCITVAHGSLLLLTEQVPLIYFSLLSSVIIYFALFDEEKVIPLLGTVLTPFLLLALSLIIYYGVVDAPEITPTMLENSFSMGVMTGYQTMDLLAALFFAPPVIHYMAQRFQKRRVGLKKQRWLTGMAFVVGAALLGIVYGFFVYLGAAYQDILSGYPVEQSLSIIAFKTLGPYAGLIVSIAVILACLTTAIILTSVFSAYTQKIVFQKKLPLHQINLITLSIAFVVSNFSFGGIAAFLNPVLEICYPVLILLTLYAVFKTVK